MFPFVTTTKIKAYGSHPINKTRLAPINVMKHLYSTTTKNRLARSQQKKKKKKKKLTPIQSDQCFFTPKPK